MIDEMAPQAVGGESADAAGAPAHAASGADAPHDTGAARKRTSSRSRRPRRTTPAPAEPANAPDAQTNVAGTPGSEEPRPKDDGPVPTPAPPVTAASAPPAPARRPRRRATQKAPKPDASKPEPALDEILPEPPPAEPPPASPPATDEPKRTQSRRGGSRRRTRPAKEAEAPAPEPEPLPDTADIGSIVETEPVPEIAASEKPKRGVRGTRKPVPAGPAVAAARVAVRRGLPELAINGQEVAPTFFFGNVDDAGAAKKVHSQMLRASRAGVRVYSTLIELVCPMPPDDSVYEALDERIEAVAAGDPAGFLMPRIVFMPMAAWREQYPFEIQMLDSGPTGEPSIASEHFWAEAQRSVRLLIEHIKRTSCGSRVIGYHLERGEWFQPAAGGLDRSYANREGFRRWLRAKYGDNEVALRSAWYDGSVQFYTADVPAGSVGAPGATFYDPRRERRWVDFMEYTSDITADRIIGLADTVKQATDGAALVSVSYGYTWEFVHPWSGHLALARVLRAPSVDIVSGPVSYSDRAPGCSGALPSPVDSPAANGKLWISEDDTKTHLASASANVDSYNSRMENASATESVHARAIGTALAHQTGISWMDLWGEGWLDSDAIWAKIGTFGAHYTATLKTRRFECPEVVALLDERSLCHINGASSLAKRVIHGNREALLRCGASVGMYLQSDVTLKSFPTEAKLYLFLTPYRLSDEERQAIRDRLRVPGKTLVWMFAVGAMNGRSAIEEPTPDAVGLNLRPQPWNSEIGTRVTEPGHPIVQFLDNWQLGSRERLSPSYYLDDDSPGITVLGEYAQTGLPSLALRSFEGWNSVFCGEPVMTPELLRGLCRFAGVHLYTRAPEDYVQAGAGWLSMHILRDGQRTLTIPDGSAIFDVADGYGSVAGSREYRTPVKAKTTRLFYVGTQAAMRKLGFDPTRVRTVAPPTESVPPPLPEPAGAPVVEAQDAMERPDDDSRVALVSGDEVTPIEPTADIVEATIPDAESDAAEGPADEATAEPRKRRRRRGGRGRGRRKPGDDTPAPAANGA
ncbi:MAG: hypothetical protein FJX72_00410 [Armatimonadetes bacterium]|nr:hypothetical protein [Armatimonadota bacterium]